MGGLGARPEWSGSSSAARPPSPTLGARSQHGRVPCAPRHLFQDQTLHAVRSVRPPAAAASSRATGSSSRSAWRSCSPAPPLVPDGRAAQQPATQQRGLHVERRGAEKGRHLRGGGCHAQAFSTAGRVARVRRRRAQAWFGVQARFAQHVDVEELQKRCARCLRTAASAASQSFTTASTS